MSDSNDKCWIGADPGGKRAFGVAIVLPDGKYHTTCVDHADAAVKWVVQSIKFTPSGVGIDAPLWWSSGKSSDRLADQWLRTKYGLSGGNVQTANSLQGAALVQGAMFLVRLRDRFPEIAATESHPKAMLRSLNTDFQGLCGKFCLQFEESCLQDDARDAVIGAISAREGFEGRWKHDLSQERHPCEMDPSTYWLKPVSYFWHE